MTSQNITHSLIGQRVKIKSKKYGGDCNGEWGIARALFGHDSIAVEIDFMRNPDSVRGWFYFKQSELTIIGQDTPEQTKGDTTMQPMKNYINIVAVHFLDDRDPLDPKTIYAANYDLSLEVGDVCVVATAHHGLALAEVVMAYDDWSDGEVFREIVTRVDMAPYRDRVEQRKKAAELKAKMQERAKQLQDIVLYQTLAKDDPEMAQLLQDYQGLAF